MNYTIVFRVDASLQIGTGHVMRCLTLADELAARGGVCQFICRRHSGNLIEFIRAEGFVVHALPVVAPADAGARTIEPTSVAPEPAHRHWLGATQAQDAEACAPILAGLQPDWLIVDHYALDAHWELALKPNYRTLMVIDDLADRPHICDVLLDQNLGRHHMDYAGLVPKVCTVLLGPHYALLRPEFAKLRGSSLKRREEPILQSLLISMGGVDGPNATSRVLEALRGCLLPDDCQLNVVMGPNAPWLHQVRDAAKGMPWPTAVLVNVADMAALMVSSDLSIGAAGSTSWERCCLGLPSIILVLAENQRFISFELDKAGAAKAITFEEEALPAQLNLVMDRYRLPVHLRETSKRAASVCDGAGAKRVRRILLGK